MNAQDILLKLKSSRGNSQFASLVNILEKREVAPLTKKQKAYLRKPNKFRVKMSTYPATNGE